MIPRSPFNEVILLKLEGKTAIITGSGRGIGSAIALAMAKEGTDIVVLSRTWSEVAETAAKVKDLGRRGMALKVDVSKIKQVERMVDLTMQKFGKIDVLINCAGIQGPIGPLVENRTEEWVKTVNINLIGTFLCCKAVLPIMIKQRYGKVINLSGGGSCEPRPRFSAYAVSKAAVLRLTETLAEEVKEFNIQVNAIAPGAVDTTMHDQVLAAGEAAGEKALAVSRRVKSGGGTSPEIPAGLAVFLASDESDGLTGRVISAVWDDWKTMAKRIPYIMSKQIYTLRRIDDVFFAPKEK